MKKKIIAIFLCMFCIFLFTGCSTDPGYEVRQNKDGSVTETIFVPYSLSELRTLGVDDEEVLLAIEDNIYQRVRTFYTEYDNNFQMRLNSDPDLDDVDKQYLASAITYHIAQTNETESVLTANRYTNGIEFFVEYDSVVAYYYYKMGMHYEEMLAELNKDDSIVEESFFIDKKINKSINLYGRDGNNSLGIQLQKLVRGILQNNTSLTNEQIESLVPHQFIYSYAVPNKKVYSDADTIYTQDGITYHQWIISDSDLDREITTWTLIPNRNVWYALVLGAGVLLSAILIVVAIVKEKQKNKQKKSSV